MRKTIIAHHLVPISVVVGADSSQASPQRPSRPFNGQSYSS
jgi:hypothetical protein